MRGLDLLALRVAEYAEVHLELGNGARGLREQGAAAVVGETCCRARIFDRAATKNLKINPN